MPCGDGTGPWWTQKRNWRCWRTSDRGYTWRWQRVPITEPMTISHEEQKTILEEELKAIEAEKHEIEKRLKELEGSTP